jgi:MFS family permease
MEQARSMLAVNIPAKLPPHLGARVLATALGVGVVADLLLRALPWGLNLTLVAGLAVLAAWVLTRWGDVQLEGEGRWLVVPVLFFAAALTWRDSATLNVANAVALGLAGTLAALTSRAGQVRLAGLTQYAVGIAYVLGYALAGLLPTLRGEIVWRRWRWRWRWWSDPALATGRGLLLALPPLVVFGGLFAAADANFEKLVRQLFDFDPSDVVVHVCLMAVYAWLLGGTLHEMLIAPLRPRQWLDQSSRLRLGSVEVAVVLALLDLLFLVFALLQLPYLFGGVVQVARLGYSEYARRGFFELVWVAGLTLPVLLWAHWLVRGSGPAGQRTYRLLALGLVCLLFVVMGSAIQRMLLYVTSLGLTELRVQASAFMGWLALALVWFMLTVLRGQRRRFAFGALASAFLVIAGLDFVNPDALIVSTNAQHGRLDADSPVDERPLASFSADATPAIVEALPGLSPDIQQAIRAKLNTRFGPPAIVAQSDWRTFNISRDQAREAVARLQYVSPRA